MSFVRCEACRGQKKVRALGCLMKKCFECQGTGYIEHEEQERFDSDKPSAEVSENKAEIAVTELPKKQNRFQKKKD